MCHPDRRRRAPRAVVLLVGIVAALGAAAPAVAAADSPDEILARLHPDHARYVSGIRIVQVQQASVSPTGIYSGLVRPGGKDPRILEDAPDPGRRNEVILYPDAIDPSRGPGWLALVLDHEYYHARHLAGGAGVPLLDFGSAGANSSYYEALAWRYVLDRALEGTYGALTAGDMHEVTAAARRHFEAFRAFVLEAQPSAWLHFSRLLADPGKESEEDQSRVAAVTASGAAASDGTGSSGDGSVHYP